MCIFNSFGRLAFRYQSLNNGNFPSLNLTHKEVGGSFYTVREIVREIIQENRVLGPAKLLPEEQNTDQLLEQYPLGTISTEPQTSFYISPNGTPFALDQHQSTHEETDLIADELCDESEQQGLNNGKIINGVIVENEASDKPRVAEVQVIEPLEAEKRLEELVAFRAKVTAIEDVIVETFPLRPVTKPTDFLDGNSGEVRYLNGSLGEKEVEEVHLGPGNSISLPDGIRSSENSILTDNKEVEKPAGPLLERNSDLDEKAVENLAYPPLGSSNSSATKEVTIVHDTQVDIDVEVKLFHNDKAIAETKKSIFFAVHVSNRRPPNTKCTPNFVLCLVAFCWRRALQKKKDFLVSPYSTFVLTMQFGTLCMRKLKKKNLSFN